MVKVSINDLNIRKGAGTNTAKTGRYTGKGVFAVFVREGAAPLPCIKGDRDSDRPWGQISQNQSKNDKKEK